MTDGLRFPELYVPAVSRQPALILRPWRAADIPAQIMLVHDVGNPASCRVAEKAGYPFRELSPANPPHWLTDGHIHMRLGG